MNVPPLPDALDEVPANAAPARMPRAARLLPRPRLGGLILALNLLSLLILFVGALTLNEWQRGLIEARQETLVAQAELLANVLADKEYTVGEPTPQFNVEKAPLLLRDNFIPAGQRARLFDVDGLLFGGPPREVATIQTALAGAVHGARVDAQGDWLRPVYRALADAAPWHALGLIALVALATAAAVWLAARNSLAQHRETVEIIHLLGGADRQITRIFLRTVLREAAFGALMGTLLALGAVWLLVAAIRRARRQPRQSPRGHDRTLELDDRRGASWAGCCWRC